MGRRVTSGVVGGTGLGSINVTSNTITTVQSNQDLVLDPNGTGGVSVVGDLSIANQGDLRLLEASGGGTNYIAMQAASAMSANYTITWPAAVAGTTGFVLSSDTSGNLSWVSAGGAITVTDPGASATAHYVIFATNSGSVPTTFAPNARSNVQFQPSTGELFSTAGRFPDVYGSTGSSGTLTFRGTTNATKAAASILMTENVASSTTSTGTLVVTGGVGVGGQVTCTTLVETSSIAFKENINPIDNALDTVMQLMGVTYDRKDNQEHEAGLIAEQVYKVAPDLVSLDSNGKPYGIKYTKLSAYLLEAIKSLKNELSEIKRT